MWKKNEIVKNKKKIIKRIVLFLCEFGCRSYFDVVVACCISFKGKRVRLEIVGDLLGRLVFGLRQKSEREQEEEGQKHGKQQECPLFCYIL